MQQLRPGGLAPLVPPHDVGVELWQVVADALDVELLVISGDAVADPTNPAAPHKIPGIARGASNNQQVILHRFADGEYTATFPHKERQRGVDFRYTAHLHTDRLYTPRAPAALAAYNAEFADKRMKRCPYMQTTNQGVVILGPGGGAVPILGYGGRLRPPPRLSPQEKIQICSRNPANRVADDATINAFINNGFWESQ